ncbi:MAG TPA: cysteine desulfurase family protein [Virgibacillus sp.]|nr:cysteine desulfurase family protein [Virgibacillus sp.]
MEHIYLDHAATTPVHPTVLDKINELTLDIYGNPSSIHHAGRKARKYLDEARRVIARSIHATEKEIIFTGSGTEADNLAIIGTALKNKHNGKHVITTEQEHHAVLHAFELLEEMGFQVTYLPVDEKGLLHLEDLEQALTDETILVSVMFVNNETGVIQPIKEIGECLADHQAYFHTDAVQAYGLLDVDVNDLQVDLLTTSAHKIYGPKGIGFLYIQNDVPIKSLAVGGNQEHVRRAGTENMMGIIGFQKAVELIEDEREERMDEFKHYRNVFLQSLEEEGVSFTINGDITRSIPSIINISFPGISVEPLLMNLDLAGISASSGSACTAGSIQPSHVLVAMYGENDKRIANSVRFSFGSLNSTSISQEAAERISEVIKRMQQGGATNEK